MNTFLLLILSFLIAALLVALLNWKFQFTHKLSMWYRRRTLWSFKTSNNDLGLLQEHMDPMFKKLRINDWDYVFLENGLVVGLKNHSLAPDEFWVYTPAELKIFFKEASVSLSKKETEQIDAFLILFENSEANDWLRPYNGRVLFSNPEVKSA